MRFTECMDRLKKQFPVQVVDCVMDGEVCAVRALPCAPPFAPDILYVGTLQDAEPLPPMSLLSHPAPMQKQGCCLAVIASSDLFSAALEAQRIIQEERSVDRDVLLHLIKESMDERPMQALMNAMARLVGNALVLVDQDQRVIAHSTEYEIADPLWHGNVERGYCDSTFMQTVRSSRHMRGWQRDQPAQTILLPGDAQPKLVTYMTTRGHLVCGLIMIEQHCAISERHKLLLPFICRLLYLTYSNSPDYGQDVVSAHTAALFRLLDEEDDDEEVIAQIQAMELAFPPQMHVVVARLVQPTENRYIKRTLVLELRDIFPSGHTVQYKGYLIVVTGEIGDKQRTALREMAKRDEVSVGISWIYADISGFKQAFHQAVACIKRAAHFGRDRDIFEYDDFFFWDLLHNYSDKVPLSRFVPPELRTLREQDAKSGGDLYPTLSAYIEQGCSLRDAAQRMFIHRNTLLYRLRRIEELTGMDLNDQRTRNKLRHTLAIDHFLSTRKP